MQVLPGSPCSLWYMDWLPFTVYLPPSKHATLIYLEEWVHSNMICHSQSEVQQLHPWICESPPFPPFSWLFHVHNKLANYLDYDLGLLVWKAFHICHSCLNLALQSLNELIVNMLSVSYPHFKCAWRHLPWQEQKMYGQGYYIYVRLNILHMLSFLSCVLTSTHCHRYTLLERL